MIKTPLEELQSAIPTLEPVILSVAENAPAARHAMLELAKCLDISSENKSFISLADKVRNTNKSWVKNEEEQFFGTEYPRFTCLSAIDEILQNAIDELKVFI